MFVYENLTEIFFHILCPFIFVSGARKFAESESFRCLSWITGRSKFIKYSHKNRTKFRGKSLFSLDSIHLTVFEVSDYEFFGSLLNQNMIFQKHAENPELQKQYVFFFFKNNYPGFRGNWFKRAFWDFRSFFRKILSHFFKITFSSLFSMNG